MSHGILHSIQFTAKLIQELENEFGTKVGELAETIAPKAEREQWLNCKPEDAVNTYIKNMHFTVNLLEQLKQEYGEKIAELTSALVACEEQIRWSNAAAKEDDHSIDHFIRMVWEPLAPLGFKFTVEKRAEGSQLHCTSCPIHELSKMIGGAEWLAILECNKDLHNVKGFNPNIGFKRTKTLMKGDSHCDHFYYPKNGQQEQGE
ncbi:L-2-amino-thiazoline-4-carboxylic acid hydrolase [Legionella micdadei]|uniref:L-2-amino-thiazoline-4-carboxylic acid hydrolase n=1 Tax=Legionella micdadei TaxID=451 RepID=A0A098GBX3_LEGMI|nr:L-2-amino-thiazoline-4-carboxylic acid hydrolase [Legionella micdadei]ARG98338.1 hypothetical protein B6N58_12065 [Legionella micdadei]ARH01090.1 hypothetical protein B6V88_12070 [Legionella micdadei]KTD27269.1 hypothetical protein Lmic_2204 [Legionella micdadei]NSL18655.1 L-2-amino-thiazoline-4-carboxylic acid hydrolase [Legionella micdadei]CEG59989.1 protein of unknown function [coiled-coil] [Legionella micdadei]